MEENLDEQDANLNEENTETKSPQEKRNKFLVLAGVVLLAIFGFSVLNSGSKPSEADCQKFVEPVSNATAMLTSMDYDSFTQVLVLQTRSEDLTQLSSEISGSGSELAGRMGSTLDAIATSYSQGNYVGAPSQEFIAQIDELKSICPSIFD